MEIFYNSVSENNVHKRTIFRIFTHTSYTYTAPLYKSSTATNSHYNSEETQVRRTCPPQSQTLQLQ